MQKQTARGILLAIIALSMLSIQIIIILPGFTPDEQWNKTYGMQDSIYHPRSELS